MPTALTLKKTMNRFNNAIPPKYKSVPGASKPLITIIVAVLNAVKTLEKCLQSIIEQRYPYKELIIMDGGSTDGSVNLPQSYNNNINYWESEPDKGIYHAWNKALQHANGDWICFLGADDYFWNDQVLSNFHRHLVMAQKDGIHVVYGKVAIIDNMNRVQKYIGKPWEKIRWRKEGTHKMATPNGGPNGGRGGPVCSPFQDRMKHIWMRRIWIR